MNNAFRTTRAHLRFIAADRRPLTEDEKTIRFNAYALKSTECPDAILRECAYGMGNEIKGDCILIPVPDHTGDTRANLRLCQAIRNDPPDGVCVDIRDILTRSDGPEHLRRTRCARPPAHRSPLHHSKDHRRSLRRVTCRQVITSATPSKLRRALGFGTGLVYADASRM